MMHKMKLRSEPFNAVKSGFKSIELRLYDEKRRMISIGDEIRFECTENSETVIKKVKALHIFSDFYELYKCLPLLKCGYTPLNVHFAKADDMNAFYPIEEQKLNKVIGIEFEEAPLQRFLAGHSGSMPECSDYKTALTEVKNSYKQTHWIWYVFPIIKGLTTDTATEYYAFDDASEAKAFYEHPLLGSRLREITSALLESDKDDPVAIFGNIDAYKLRACMTLYTVLYPDDNIFEQVINKYCMGIKDENVIDLIN